MKWYIEVLKKYAVFEGRAQREEYWMFFLINFIIAFALGGIEIMMGIDEIISKIYLLAIFIPGLAVGVRRLHDTNRSGWWFLIAIVPIIGNIALLVFLVQDSIPGNNEYGPNPKNMPKTPQA